MVEQYQIYVKAIEVFPESLKANLNKILNESTDIQDGIFFGNSVMSYLELKNLFSSGRPIPTDPSFLHALSSMIKVYKGELLKIARGNENDPAVAAVTGNETALTQRIVDAEVNQGDPPPPQQ